MIAIALVMLITNNPVLIWNVNGWSSKYSECPMSLTQYCGDVRSARSIYGHSHKCWQSWKAGNGSHTLTLHGRQQSNYQQILEPMEGWMSGKAGTQGIEWCYPIGRETDQHLVQLHTLGCPSVLESYPLITVKISVSNIFNPDCCRGDYCSTQP